MKKEPTTRFWFIVAMAVSLLGIAVLAENTAEAKPHWYSGRVINDKAIPSAAKEAMRLETETAMPDAPVLFDLVVSLYNYPVGDDDGNTQGNPGSEEQDTYERIFQYFADAVYESTEGAHKIRTIRIYRDGLYSSLADIYWDAEGVPGSPPDGISVSGRRIDMFDTFLGVCGPGCDRNMLEYEEGAGYTLVHEWAHYAYGLYDEHRGTEATSPWDGTPLLDDTPVKPSIMTDHWLAIGGGWRYKWLNFSVAATHDPPDADPPWELFENTSDTAQHRVRGASCWETLARPTSLDPRPAHETSTPSRTYYPELAAVAPAVGDMPSWTDLPGTARSDLNIIWMTDTLVYQVVIDHSGSMCFDPAKLENAKTAAKLLVNLAVEGASTIGVIQFDHEVEIVSPLTPIPDTATKLAINTQIDGIVCRGATAVGDAAQRALDDLLAMGTDNDSKVVFLLTDGMSNTGVDPLTVIPAYQMAQIPMMTFAYGADADVATLRQMANDTGGSLYISPTTLSAVTTAFQDANLLVSSRSSIASGTRTVPSGTLVEIPFVIDSTLTRLDVTISHNGNSSNASITLLDPNGMAISPHSMYESGTETFRFFSVDMPMEDEWILQVEPTGADLFMVYQVSGMADQVTYTLSVESVGGSTVHYPEPVVLMATIERGLPIIGANVAAWIVKPDLSWDSVAMKDDGIAPDKTALDGVYSAILDYDQGGVYEFFVKMDNADGQAALTHNGIASPDIFGSRPPLPADVPISEDFDRFTKLRFDVEGVRADDHGNTAASATPCGVGNGDIAGKIDQGGDVDVFSVNIPQAVMDEVIVRVTNLALDMDPRLRILDDDGVTLLCDYSLADAISEGGYLAVKVPATLTSDFYAMVSHTKRDTGTGTYKISVGPKLVEEGNIILPYPPVVPSGGGGGGGGGGCFIATAAYGSPMAEEVATLREFRDRYLLTNAPGKRVVEFYYKTSPRIAEYISERESLCALSRIGLTPIIWTCKLWLTSPVLGFAFVIFAVGILPLGMCIFVRKKKRGQR